MPSPERVRELRAFIKGIENPASRLELNQAFGDVLNPKAEKFPLEESFWIRLAKLGFLALLGKEWAKSALKTIELFTPSAKVISSTRQRLDG